MHIFCRSFFGFLQTLIPVFVLMAEKESETTPSATTSRMPPGAGIGRQASGKPISVQRWDNAKCYNQQNATRRRDRQTVQRWDSTKTYNQQNATRRRDRQTGLR
jgi:hypothetical protein